MNLIIVNGKGGSGKDAFENYIIDYISSNYKNYLIQKISIIDTVKKFLKDFYWWNPDIKTNKERKFLANFKKILEEYNDLPFQNLKKEIKIHTLTGYKTLFIDLRESYDIERLKEEYKDNIKTILIKRQETNDKNYGNAADDNVFNYDYDYIIENNGSLDNLKEKAIKWAEDNIL